MEKISNLSKTLQAMETNFKQLTEEMMHDPSETTEWEAFVSNADRYISVITAMADKTKEIRSYLDDAKTEEYGDKMNVVLFAADDDAEEK